MQVSVETTSSIERRMTIGVPADKVAQEINSRLQKTASTVKINGFRPGKVPLSVVKKNYGPSIRQEVIGELMRNTYVEALTQEKLSPVGYPNFEPKNLEEGQDLEFIATFEVYPEITLADTSGLEVTRESAEIVDADVDNMIELLRKQKAELKVVERKSQDKDTVTVDYKGSVDGDLFEGGSADDAKIALGSGQMIPGFEDGLVGVSAGDNVELNVTFPEEYQNADLAGKAAVFAVTVKQVEEQELAALDKDFFAKYGVGSETLEEFKAEIVKNMQRELKQATSNKVKQQIVDGLVKLNDVQIPKSLTEQEIQRLKEEAVQQFGGQMKADDLPNEIFQEQADKRVSIGLIFAEIVKQNKIEVSEGEADAKIAEMASTYQEPENVIEWYKSQPEQKAQIESVIMEEKVVDLILQSAQVTDISVSYEEAIKPPVPAAEEAEETTETSTIEAEQ